MITAKCLQKFRDNNNVIIGYLLEDCNGQKRQVEAKELKNAIYNGQVNVVNLKLTSDGKLIDSAEPNNKDKSNDRIFKFLNHHHQPSSLRVAFDLDKTLNEKGIKTLKIDRVQVYNLNDNLMADIPCCRLPIREGCIYKQDSKLINHKNAALWKYINEIGIGMDVSITAITNTGMIINGRVFIEEITQEFNAKAEDCNVMTMGKNESFRDLNNIINGKVACLEQIYYFKNKEDKKNSIINYSKQVQQIIIETLGLQKVKKIQFAQV